MSSSVSQPLCLLLPGTDGTGEFYTGLVQALSPYTDVRILSYPSARALDYAALCRHLLPELPLNREYVLIAESFAGPLAILLADAALNKPVKIVLATSFAATPWPVSGRLLSVFAGLGTYITPPLCVIDYLLLSRRTAHLSTRIKSVIQSLDRHILITRIKTVIGCDVRASLVRLTLPILYLRGTRDRLVPARCADQMRAANSRVRVTDIDAPHFLLQDDPQTLTDTILLPFLTEP